VKWLCEVKQTQESKVCDKTEKGNEAISRNNCSYAHHADQNIQDVVSPLVLHVVRTLGRVRVHGTERVLVVLERTVDVLLKDGLRLVDVELGLEVLNVSGHGATVGAAAWVDKVERLVNNLLAHAAPVALAIAVLLGLLGIGVGKPVLGKELGHVVIGRVGLCHVATRTVVELVGASHCAVLVDVLTLIYTKMSPTSKQTSNYDGC
jgi:hypothetical protein